MTFKIYNVLDAKVWRRLKWGNIKSALVSNRVCSKYTWQHTRLSGDPYNVNPFNVFVNNFNPVLFFLRIKQAFLSDINLALISSPFLIKTETSLDVVRILMSNDSSARGRAREKHSLDAILYVDFVIIFALRTPTTNVVD